MHDLVFLFDVDNTLLDNDRVQADLADHLTESYGAAACNRYWDIFEQVRHELGYADYLGALERFRLEKMHDPRVLRMSSWLVDYPFANRLYRGALRAVQPASRARRDCRRPKARGDPLPETIPNLAKLGAAFEASGLSCRMILIFASLAVPTAISLAFLA
jgi:FMN phosphatase YigB (HAD superfamily)